MIRALKKFAENPYGGIEIDTTSGIGQFRELSPFILPTKLSKNFENLWQYSKVYSCHIGPDGLPNEQWYEWRYAGWHDVKAHRYPMGKGAVPLYSYWANNKLGYIEARKAIYAPVYASNVKETDSFKRLMEIYETRKDIVLRDYDTYDHVKLGMSLVDVINNPNRKMGHSFVIIMVLTGVLDECITS